MPRPTAASSASSASSPSYRRCPLSLAELDRVAELADVSARTVRRYVVGETVSSPVARAVGSALVALGWRHLLRSPV